jgi:Arc/MetJ-type ribon-helix-helix transcriptional regulator
MKTIQATVSEQLDRDIDLLVEHGWFESREQVLQEALRRFLEANHPSLMERFARDDVEWGLRGQT